MIRVQRLGGMPGINVRPRIIKRPNSRWWVCVAFGFAGAGRSPKEAYEDWAQTVIQGAFR